MSVSGNPFDEEAFAPLRTAQAAADDVFAASGLVEGKVECAEAAAAEAASAEAAGAGTEADAEVAAEAAAEASEAAAVQVSPPRFGMDMEDGCHSLLRTGRHADLSFVVGSETMRAHRAILEARCGAALVQALEGGGIGVTESLAIGAEGVAANTFDRCRSETPTTGTGTGTPPTTASSVLVVRLEGFSPPSVALLLRFLCTECSWNCTSSPVPTSRSHTAQPYCRYTERFVPHELVRPSALQAGVPAKARDRLPRVLTLDRPHPIQALLLEELRLCTLFEGGMSVAAVERLHGRAVARRPL